jgi:SAM-dependent methyltransferase
MVSDMSCWAGKARVNDAATIERCLRGEELYGDNFSLSEIEAWFKDEEEGYYDLGSKERDGYVYAYHSLNWLNGYSALPPKTFRHVLGIGSAYGDELRPVAHKALKVTILEPSKRFRVTEIEGTPVEYVKPNPGGQMPFSDGAFDLITCLGVLHHIPNVSTVLREIYRCAAPGAFVLVREPIVSMGDWRKPRKGLTKRERGIPLRILRDTITTVGFDVVRERKCMFPVTMRLQYVLRVPVFNSRLYTYADSLVCRLPFWGNTYHARNALEKLRPNAIFFALRKPSSHERACFSK